MFAFWTVHSRLFLPCACLGICLLSFGGCLGVDCLVPEIARTYCACLVVMRLGMGVRLGIFVCGLLVMMVCLVTVLA